MGKVNHPAWKKGESGNPKGSSKRKKELGKLTRMTHEQIADIGTTLLSGNIEQLKTIMKAPESTALQSWTAALVLQSIKKGDSGIYRAVLDRIAGKIPETIHHKELAPETETDIRAEIAQARADLKRLKG
jgi:hypothetical protein